MKRKMTSENKKSSKQFLSWTLIGGDISYFGWAERYVVNLAECIDPVLHASCIKNTHRAIEGKAFKLKHVLHSSL
jgi:hypothetical protein